MIILQEGGVKLLIIIISYAIIFRRKNFNFQFFKFLKKKTILNWNLNDFVQKKFQIDQLLDLAELLNLSYSTEIIPDFRKNRIPDPNFFGLKPPRDQYGANKKSLA